jgi:hypothetical protein
VARRSSTCSHRHGVLQEVGETVVGAMTTAVTAVIRIQSAGELTVAKVYHLVTTNANYETLLGNWPSRSQIKLLNRGVLKSNGFNNTSI